MKTITLAALAAVTVIGCFTVASAVSTPAEAQRWLNRAIESGKPRPVPKKRVAPPKPKPQASVKRKQG